MNDILSPSDKDGDSPDEDILSMKGVGEKTLATILGYLGSDSSNFFSPKTTPARVFVSKIKFSKNDL